MELLAAHGVALLLKRIVDKVAMKITAFKANRHLWERLVLKCQAAGLIYCPSVPMNACMHSPWARLGNACLEFAGMFESSISSLGVFLSEKLLTRPRASLLVTPRARMHGCGPAFAS